jgi:hypothetical protein
MVMDKDKFCKGCERVWAFNTRWWSVHWFKTPHTAGGYFVWGRIQTTDDGDRFAHPLHNWMIEIVFPQFPSIRFYRG